MGLTSDTESWKPIKRRSQYITEPTNKDGFSWKSEHHVSFNECEKYMSFLIAGNLDGALSETGTSLTPDEGMSRGQMLGGVPTMASSGENTQEMACGGDKSELMTSIGSRAQKPQRIFW